MATAKEIAEQMRKKKQEEWRNKYGYDNTIAPTEEENQKWYEGWFDAGAFDDGWQFGDLVKTILGTAVDIGENVNTAVVDATENLVDTIAYGVGAIGGLFDEGFKDDVGDFIAQDTFKAEQTGKWMTGASTLGIPYLILGGDIEDESVISDKGDSMVQSAAHLVGSYALSFVGVPTWLTMGVNAFGSEIEAAFQEDAEFDEAGWSGLIAAASEIIFEKLSGAINISGGSTLDDVFLKGLSREAAEGVGRGAAKFGVDLVGEGLEEVCTDVAVKLGQHLTYKSDGDLGDKLEGFWGDLSTSGDDLMTSFVSGAAMSAGGGAINVVNSNKAGVDSVTHLTSSEEKVVKKIYNDAVAKAEANGKKLSIGDKNKLWDEAVKQLSRGEISTDTIEEVLGGDTYKSYNDTVKNEDSILNEFKKLGEKENPTLADQSRYAELQNLVKDINENSKRAELKSQLSNNVIEMLKGERKGGGSYLLESYFENSRRGQSFEADLSKYDSKQAEIIQKAIDSGILNNTNRTHEFVDMVAKISADKGVSFDFTNNERLKESGFAIDGKFVNGFYNNGNITLNMNSSKTLDTVVGHEITHVLEGTELYNELQNTIIEYSKTKGDYQKRLEALTKLYEGIEGADINAELTADLVGDYLFTDEDFVRHLSTTNRNVFEKIFDEIKYLYKMATAGSKEARKLEEVKHTFEKVWKESTTNNVEGTKYSLSSMAHTFFGNENMTVKEFEEGNYKQTEGYKVYVEQCLNNLRQTRTDFNEVEARKEIEDSIKGIVDVALAMKKAGYDILDSGNQRDVRDSKNRLLFSSLEPNSDYFTSSDISTICDKRKNFAEIYDDIVRAEESKGVPLNKRFFSNIDNYFYLHQLMAEKGLTQPCRECYVESMRKNLAPMANAFLKLIQETDANNTLNDQLYQQRGKNKGNLKVNNAKTREWVLDKLAEYDMSPSDLNVKTLTTAKGLAELKIKAPLIYEAFNSFYGQSKPKMPKAATPFRFGELTALLTNHDGTINQRLVNQINSTGGFRLQSYSDFQIQNFADVLQVIYEAGTLGLNGHAYTKVPEFLDATEGTNLKRNISIFMYKDGNEWKLDKNDSFPMELEEIYDLVKADKSGNTSIIAVSQNADMSAWIMANDYVGYFIPFHKSGLKMNTVRETIVKENGREIKGYTETKDHTKQQTEVWAKATDDHKALTKVKKPVDIYSFWDFDNKGNLSKNELIEKNVKAYIDACNEAGYLPKFREYVMNNSKVLNNVLEYSKQLGFASQDATIDDISFEYSGYRIPYGYYKCLGDFGMFTPNGKASPQETLSLKNYDFKKATDFFANPEELRRNEILRQFVNGEERAKYRDSNLTTEQLTEILKQKRGEIVRDVVGDIAPTDYSLSQEGETSKGRFYGKDMLLQEDIAPVGVAENTTTTSSPKVDSFSDEFAPVVNSYTIEQEADRLMEQAEEANNNGDKETAERLAKQAYELYNKAAEMQTQEDADHKEYMDSITDADIPMESMGDYGETNTTPIDDKTLTKLTKGVRDALSCTSKESKAIREVIENYTKSNQSKSELFRVLKDKFGDKYEYHRYGEIAEAQKWLKNSKITVSDHIKGDIADYGDYKKLHNFREARKGTPVDIAYEELSGLYPSLFSSEIVNETDRFERINEVMAMPAREWVKVSELSDAEIMRAADLIHNEVVGYRNNEVRKAAEANARVSIDDIAPSRASEITEKSLGDSTLNYQGIYHEAPIKTVKERVAEKLSNTEKEITDNKRLRADSIVDFNREIERLQEEYNAKANKNTKVANDILRRIERLQTMRNNIDADYEKRINDLTTKAEKMKTPAYQTAMQRQAKTQEYKEWAENLIGDTTTWVDKKLGLSYKTNTLKRNLRDVVRDAQGNRDIAKADAIYDELQGTYNHNEAKLNRESNRIKKVFADMKITSAEDVYIQMLGEFKYNPETTLTANVVNEYYEANKDKIDVNKVNNAIELARKNYDGLLERVNEVLSEQGMKEIPYRKGYFPHFTDTKQSKLAKLLNWKTQDNEIPTSIAGLTEQFNPNRSWQSFNKQRTTDTTDYRFTKGFDTYVHGALDWIYHIEDIQKRRAFENELRYIHSEQGIKDRVEALFKNEEYDADELQEQIDLVYQEARNPLNNFVTDLRAGTNTLANKKSSMDRGVEEMTNRKFYSTMTNLSNRVSANMVGGSVSSALTNFIPITQSWGEVSPVSSLKAMGETIRATFRDDGVIDKSDFLTNRLKKSDNLYKTTWDKISNGLGAMMEGIDSFTSQTVWRSKYLENISNGMSESEAIKNADQFAEGVMAGRSRGNQPTLFDSKNPLIKTLTAFQLEVNNQYGYMFKDMPQNMQNETKGKLVKGYASIFIGAFVYNALYSALTGRNAAFDPIRIVQEFIGDLFDDDEEEPMDAVLGLAENVAQELPFVGGLLGGGRVPISSALPYDGNVMDIIEGTGNAFNGEDVKTATKEWLKPLLYLASPMGGGQFKKTVEGLLMFSDEHPIAGSYTDSGNLRFPVEDTFWSKAQAAIFGQYASQNAQDYFDNDIAPLNENQTQEFIDVNKTGMSIQDYWDYRKGLSGLTTLAEKADYINSLNLTAEQKNILINNIANRKEDIDMSDYGNYSSFEEFDFANKYPSKYAVAQSVGGYEAYMIYSSGLNDIKADKDANGNSISGSRKKKVVAYINSLNADYGTKIILFKSEYPSDNTYDRDIIDYLNNRDDISYQQMKTILEELGFKVDSKGNITLK